MVIKVGKNKATDTEQLRLLKSQQKRLLQRLLKKNKNLSAKPVEEPKEKQPAAPATEPTPQPVEKPVIPEPKMAETSENPEAETQEAVINFIDLDQNGKQLTSSGVLRGMPGDSINDLYSSEIPLKVIKKAGYKVVFNNFDIPGVTQRFSNNKMMIQIFTIGLSKKDSTEGNN